MQELLELRALIQQGRYPEALVLLGELDEMSHEDDEVYTNALRLASREAFEGRYDPPELAVLVDEGAIKEQALHLITKAQ
jgi:hypothetical protein